MTAARWVALGAWSAGVAVALGAFGAHGLQERVAAEQLAWWETGVHYHVLHALALVLFGLHAGRTDRAPHWVGWAFLLGAALFSGTLYAMTLGGPRWLGAVTPFGGTALIVAWVGFGLHAWRAGTRSAPPPTGG